MGCVPSHPVDRSSRRTHSGHPSSYNRMPADASSFGASCSTFVAPTYPPPVMRGRLAHHQNSSSTHQQYASSSYANHDGHSESYAHYVRIRDVSPPRHRNELPRRHASHRYRDVSPLGSSRFERPFERAHFGDRKTERMMRCNFEGGGVGGWENW